MNWDWIAGFYEGEGTVAYTNSGKRGITLYLKLVIGQKQVNILRKIAAFLRKRGHKCYIWSNNNARLPDGRPTEFHRLTIQTPSSVKVAHILLRKMHHPYKIKQLLKGLGTHKTKYRKTSRK